MLKLAVATTGVIALVALVAIVASGEASDRGDRPSVAVELILRDAGSVEPASGEEIAEWCGGPEGRRLSGLYSETLATAEPRRLERTTDEILEVADSAPAGAPCAADLLSSLADYWQLSAGEPGFEAVEPRGQAERVRDAQRENGLGRPPGR